MNAPIRCRPLRRQPAVFLTPRPARRPAPRARLGWDQIVCVALSILVLVYLAAQIARSLLSGGVP
jgi:hypothetical protein